MYAKKWESLSPDASQQITTLAHRLIHTRKNIELYLYYGDYSKHS